MFLLTAALGADLNVCGGCTYPTVAEAINAAGEGDNVIIAENEVIVETTTADPSAADIHVFVANQGTADVTLTGNPWLALTQPGLVIEGLNITPTTNDKVLDMDSGSVTFRDIVFGTHAGDDDGGLFHVDDGLLTLDSVTISGATTSKKGGVVFMHGGGEAVIKNSTISGATAASDGGGVANVEEGSITFDNTVVTGATQAVPGSIVYVKTNGSVTVQNGTLFDGGAASAGGHIYIPATATLDIFDSTLQNGEATSASGGSIYMADGTLTAENADFYGNTTAADGGAIAMLSGTATIDNSLFETNTSVIDGAAVYTTNADFTFTNTDFHTNDARWGTVYLEEGGLGDLVFNDCDAIDNTADQGAVAHLDGSGSLEVNGGIWTGNTAVQGAGAIAMHSIGGLTLDGTTITGSAAQTGGVIESFYSDLTLIGGSLSGSATGAGGCVTMSANLTLTSTDTDYTDCVAGTSGGAVFAASNTIEIDGGTFSGNTADRGGALFLNSGSTGFVRDATFDSNLANGTTHQQGGAIWAYPGDLAIGRNEFCLNAAGSAGGAMYLYYPATATDVFNNVFCANAATDTGGAIWTTSATGGPSMRNNTFLGNDSAQGAAMWIGNSMTLVNNLFAFNYTSNAVYRNLGVVTYTSNYFYGNAADSNDAVTTGQDDPGLSGYDDCVDDSYVHDYDGPLVDAGTGTDPDGSPADIGAYGGPDADPDAFADEDSDTWVAMWDCDDELGSGENNYPTNDEECDGVDNDCDGLVDDDDTSVVGQETWYEDTDGDGFGAGSASGPSCEPPPGTWVTVDGDCEPDEAQINPNTDWYVDADDDEYGGEEVASIEDQCADPSTGPGQDNYAHRPGDCEDTDENINPETVWYEDKDDDEYGDDTDPGDQQCEAPTDVPHVYVQGDCDDDDPAENPESSWYLDDDGDGYGAGAAVEQCEKPSEFHVLDNTDCDDQDPDQDPETVWYMDRDGDGFGDPDEVTVVGCDDPSTNQLTYVYVAGDCDDSAAGIRPDADEVCDEVDNDCNGDVDEDDTDIDPQLLTDFYPDTDEDGFGDEDASPVSTCSAPTDHVADNTDCDDAETNVYPGAPELCDNIDNDCDDKVETPNQVQYVDWYYDDDGDGYGAGTPQNDCQQPEDGMVTNGTDCDDTAGAGADINPGEDEVCDGVDNDCSGAADDNPTDGTTYYVDDDEDGYGIDGTGVDYCPGSEPAKTASLAGDCDDTETDVNPGQLEVCNGVDDDCNQVVDDNALDAQATYADTDGDGYGDPDEVVYACSAQSGYVLDDTDCDDEVDTTYPGAPEQCDGVDNDCDDDTDEQVVYQDYYPDEDEDGYGDGTATPLNDCTAPEGYVLDTSDCDDDDAQAYPDATETWYDGVDSDCAGDNDYDQDGDGYVAEGYGDQAGALEVGDCDDTDPQVNPGNGDCTEPTSSRDEVESDAWTDTPESAGSPKAGCDCDSGGRTPFGFAPLLALVLLRRRRSASMTA